MTDATAPMVAVLDANVLYPQWLRDVMLTLAAGGTFDPIWSDQIIDEMRRNVLHDHRVIDRITSRPSPSPPCDVPSRTRGSRCPWI